MRIAMFHEMPKGGGERSIYEISNGLRERGVVVDLYTTNNKKDIQKKFFHKTFIYDYPVKKWLGRNWKRRLYKDTVEMISLYFLHKKIAKDIDCGYYDFAFINSSQYIENPFILRFLRTKSVLYCHDPHDRLIYDPLNRIPDNLGTLRNIYERALRFIRKILDIQNIRHAKIILTNSNYSKQAIKRTYCLKSDVAHLGVDTKVFYPSPHNKEFDVLFIGSTSKFDGFDLFLDVVANLPKKYVVRSILAEQEWLTGVAELREMYSKSKILLALGVREPFGLVPLEAMACGIPVVAIDEAGYKESIIEGETGYLVRNNASEIAKRIVSLLNNDDIRLRMGEKARNHIIRNWTWEKSIDYIYDFLSRRSGRKL